MTELSNDGILGEVHVSKVGMPATFWDLVITQDCLFFVQTSKASFFLAMFGVIGLLIMRSKAKKRFLATVAKPLDDKIDQSPQTISIARENVASLTLKKRKLVVQTTDGEKYTFNYFDKTGCADGQDPNTLLAAYVPGA